jgi:hypothetical protein
MPHAHCPLPTAMDFNFLKRNATKPGHGFGRDGVENDSATSGTALTRQGRELDGKLAVCRRHVDWLENQIRWRWLLDSFEGGDRYRNAVYGPDRRGLPARNLFRHKR